MKIIESNNCKNSPKNKFIEDYSIALLSNELPKVNYPNILIISGTHYETVADIETYFKSVTLDYDCVLCKNSITHGKHGTFLGLLSKDNESKFVSIHYDFTSVKGNKIEKVTIIKD